MQSSRLVAFSRSLFIIALVFAFVWIIPSPWFPLQLGKVAAFSILFGIAAVVFAFGGGVRDFFRSNGYKTALLVLLLPAVYAASYYLSLNRAVGISGYAVEGDTVLFVLLCALAFLLSFVLFKAASAAQLLLKSVAVAGLVAVFVQYIVMLFGTTLVPFAIFSDRSVNIVGKWNDLGLLAGLVLILVLFSLEFVHTTLVRRIVLGVLAVALVVLLAIIQFPLIWGIVLGFSLLLALWSFMSKTAEGKPTFVPWLPLIAAGVSTLFLLWGAAVNTNLVKVFPVSSLEVRPSFNSTLDIVRASHGTSLDRFVLGTGPQTFSQHWLLHKPTEVNQSPFWNLDFSVGFSIFATALASVGVMGALAWLFPLVLVLLALVRVLRSSHVHESEKKTALFLGVGSVYLWCSLVLYVPSQIIVILAFVLGGAAFGFAMHRLSLREQHTQDYSRLAAVVFFFAAVVFVAASLWCAFVAGRRFVAQTYTNQGLLLLNQGDTEGALARMRSAQKIEPTYDALRLSVAAHNAVLEKIVTTDSPTPSEELQAQFKAEVEAIITDGQRAIAYMPQDYRGHVALAKAYDLLASLKVSGAYESAKKSYEDAAVYNPKNPEIALSLARLDAVQGSSVAVIEKNLAKALTLKSDYTDAILFLVQLNVANKDIPNAIKAAQAAVRSAPGVPVIWFQLGLLYYTAGDMDNAATVLGQAVVLQPDYANAKYFLGLAYAASGKTPEAVQQFVDLEKTNPDNQEVKLILGNLRAGKPPFENAQPPVTDTPEERTTAPIAQ